MKRLARVLPLAMILLVLGAVVNIAVAWVLSPAAVPNPRRSYIGPVQEQWWSKIDPQPSWPRPTPERWSEPISGILYQRGGATHRIWTAYPTPRQGCTIAITSAGWPMRSLAFEQWSEFDLERGGRQTDGHPHSPFRLGAPWRGGPKRLPLTPIPAGFAINTLLYGAPAAGVWLVAHRIRGAIRVRRERCSGCGYARTGIPAAAPCPECGRPLV
jgi:hypothetical protein